MTFEEWWKDSEKSVYWCNNPDIRSLCKCIAQSAWKAAQPKWTYCKDGMPTEKDGEVVKMPMFEDLDDNFIGDECIPLIATDGKKSFEHYYDLTKKKFISDTIIAWMPLPKVSGEQK